MLISALLAAGRPHRHYQKDLTAAKRTFSQPFSSVMQVKNPASGAQDVSAGEVDDDVFTMKSVCRAGYLLFTV